MDSSIKVGTVDSNIDAVQFELRDYQDVGHLWQDFYAQFGERARYALEVLETGQVPIELFERANGCLNGSATKWLAVLDYVRAAEQLKNEGDNEAFMAYFEAKGSHGQAAEALAEFERTYQGEFVDDEAYGDYLADELGLPEWAKPYFDAEKFGFNARQDGTVLGTRYYFKY